MARGGVKDEKMDVGNTELSIRRKQEGKMQKCRWNEMLNKECCVSGDGSGCCYSGGGGCSG